MEQFSDMEQLSDMGTIGDLLTHLGITKLNNYNINYRQINWSQITLLWIDV